MTTGSGPRHYLLVTHIPFVRAGDTDVIVDGLWARDLQGLAGSFGPIRVAAPELLPTEHHSTWGPTPATLSGKDGVTFAGFPPIRSRRDFWRWPAVRRILKQEVEAADLIHTSNYFPPYVGLSYAHHLAVSSGRKTLFVVAEDFYDMLQWEWVRNSHGGLERFRRERALRALDRGVIRSIRSASLTFFHTPAAVMRYRLECPRGIAIRQPGHELEDVIGGAELKNRCAELQAGCPLIIIAACRHKALKGIDFLIAAIATLSEQGVPIEARIYGEGTHTPVWEALAARLGVSEQVRFCGVLDPGPPVYQAIRRGHIFAMPHRTTDFGRAFYDAMASACPVIAFRNPATNDTVRDGIDGFLAPPDDVEGLAGVLRRLHCDRALLVRASIAARDRAVHNTRSHWFRLRAGWIQSLFDTRLEEHLHE